MKVMIVSNLPSDYYVQYLDELSNYVDLIAVFERDYNLHKNAKSGINWEAKNYNCIFLSSKKNTKENIFSTKIIKTIRKYPVDVIVFANPCSPTGILGELYCKFKRIKYCLQSEGGFVPDKTRFRDIFKKFYMKDASMFLTGMNLSNNYFKKYGATESKLKKYNFTSLHDKDIISYPPSEDEKSSLKSNLGLNFETCIICVGQFIKRKGIDTLIEACKGLPDNVGLVIIGGVVPQEYKDLVETNFLTKNVVFVNRIDKLKLGMYYRASDIFVLLTREDIWGLVINEAMGYGLPIITTNRTNAGLELIENGKNGYIVNADDPNGAHSRIFELLNNKELRTVMSKNNIEKIRDYTIENMGKTIYSYLKTI